MNRLVNDGWTVIVTRNVATASKTGPESTDYMKVVAHGATADAAVDNLVRKVYGG